MRVSVCKGSSFVLEQYICARVRRMKGQSIRDRRTPIVLAFDLDVEFGDDNLKKSDSRTNEFNACVAGSFTNI